MKCSELQVGDYVRFKRTKEVVWVFEIDGDRNVINNEPDGYCSEKNIAVDDVEPIPLTSEILKKNGFTENYRYDDLSYIQSCGAITGIHINGENGLMEEMYFNYVHEVQNALRICGLSDLADNFKLED